MAEQEDMIGYGSNLLVSDGTALWTSSTPPAGTFTAIGSIIELAVSGDEFEDVDTTPLNPTDAADKHRTFKSGLADGGTIDVTIKYLASDAVAVRALGGVTKAYKVLHDDDSGLGINGYIKSFGREIPMDNLITCPISIKVTGKTFDLAAS